MANLSTEDLGRRSTERDTEVFRKLFKRDASDAVCAE
jgi:hypothetical protein